MKHRQVGISGARVMNTDGHVIGIDVGASAVRATILSPGMVDGRPSVTIAGSGVVPLERGVVINGVVHEPESLTGALLQLWAENRFECRNVILGIANQQVTVRHLTVPALSPEQRRKALPYQAKDIVALPLDQVILDFCQLGEPDPESGLVHGLLVAAPQEPILVALRAAEKANLRVARVDLASFGCLRAIADENVTAEAVIDMGAQLTTIVIHDGGVPKLVRTLTRGGDELTEMLADRQRMAPGEAENAKREVGLTEPTNPVSRVLRDALRPLIAEIRTSIGYFRTNAERPLESVSLTGGAAELPGIAEALSDQIGIPVRLVDPMQHVRNKPSQVAGTVTQSDHRPSAVSMGLAMGAAA